MNHLSIDGSKKMADIKIPFNEDGKYHDGTFLFVKGKQCPNCNKYLGETLEIYCPNRYHGWGYYRCESCKHEWDSFIWTPTGGSGPGDLDDLRPEEDQDQHHYYLKDGEPKRFTERKFKAAEDRHWKIMRDKWGMTTITI